MKSRRADGIAALERAAMEMESCRADSASYAGCETAHGIDGRLSGEGYYLITAPASSTPTAYAFEATAQGVQAGDTQCRKLTLDSQGNRGYAGSAPNADTCWGK
jgi:Tfp pilus assembly protein PilE